MNSRPDESLDRNHQREKNLTNEHERTRKVSRLDAWPPDGPLVGPRGPAARVVLLAPLPSMPDLYPLGAKVSRAPVYTRKLPHRTIFLDRPLAFSITNRFERLAEGTRPLSRQVMSAMP